MLEILDIKYNKFRIKLYKMAVEIVPYLGINTLTILVLKFKHLFLNPGLYFELHYLYAFITPLFFNCP